MASRKDKIAPRQGIHKSPTGIVGLDQITGGGLPAGRPTLVCGSAGCGKTMLAMEFSNNAEFLERKSPQDATRQ